MGRMTSKGTVDLSGMDRTFFGVDPGGAGRTAVPSACAGGRTGGEAGSGLDQLVAPAVLRWSLRPDIRDPDRQDPAVQSAAGVAVNGTGAAGPIRAQAGQAARHQRNVAVRGPGSRAQREPLPDNLRAACGTPFEMWDRQSGHSAHFVLDLERRGSGIRIACVRHRYHAIECACGIRTAARPGLGVLSTVPGRTRDLRLSEACLVGPALATLIAALSGRDHVSRARIREFLAVWFSVPLSVGTLDRGSREVGVACEPVVADLLGDLRQAGVIHADETPWRQHGRWRWLWVVLSSTTAIFHIGSRQADEIRDLVGDAFLGWLVSDGYGAYRQFKKRHHAQRGAARGFGPDHSGRAGTRHRQGRAARHRRRRRLSALRRRPRYQP
jgi:hypothetical protein